MGRIIRIELREPVDKLELVISASDAVEDGHLLANLEKVLNVASYDGAVLTMHGVKRSILRYGPEVKKEIGIFVPSNVIIDPSLKTNFALSVNDYLSLFGASNHKTRNFYERNKDKILGKYDEYILTFAVPY
ncbi:hypothetical protein BVX95_01805 [archaeon D22]|nr:hypothetical protein BVX95_01805 [archaeon D22]